MSAYNYKRVTKQFNQQFNFNRSERLALDNGFKVVHDENAYNSRYFIKDGKKWIHNFDALKRQFRTNNDRELEEDFYN